MHKILLIDDDPDDRDLFKEALAQISSDAQFISFNDGRKAVDWLSNAAPQELPHAIVMDYNMPHMTAPQLLDWLCQQDRLNNIPKIVWSTAAQPEYYDNCKTRGAIEYFTKPTTQEALKWIVEQVIGFIN